MSEDKNEVFPFYEVVDDDRHSMFGLSTEGELVIYTSIYDQDIERTKVLGKFEGISAAGGTLWALFSYVDEKGDTISAGVVIQIDSSENNLRVQEILEERLETRETPLIWPENALPPYDIEEIKDAVTAYLILDQYIPQAQADTVITPSEQNLIEAGLNMVNEGLADIEVEGSEALSELELANARMNILREQGAPEFLDKLEASITQEDWDRVIGEIEEAAQDDIQAPDSQRAAINKSQIIL